MCQKLLFSDKKKTYKFFRLTEIFFKLFNFNKENNFLYFYINFYDSKSWSFPDTSEPNFPTDNFTVEPKMGLGICKFLFLEPRTNAIPIIHIYFQRISDLHDNRMSTLPADFSAFDCLISCIASSNRFRTIPTCICSLEQLTFIDFR